MVSLDGGEVGCFLFHLFSPWRFILFISASWSNGEPPNRALENWHGTWESTPKIKRTTFAKIFSWRCSQLCVCVFYSKCIYYRTHSLTAWYLTCWNTFLDIHLKPQRLPSTIGFGHFYDSASFWWWNHNQWAPSYIDYLGLVVRNHPLFTLPETNSSPLKIGHPKRKLVFQTSIFRCYVSFREGSPLHNQLQVCDLLLT